MNLRQIEVFRAVMTTGSTTHAARLLHVAQPGVSRIIKHVEMQLGVALFERRNSKLLPTPAAHALQAEVEKVYRGVQHLRDVAQHLRFGDHQTLRVLSSANTGLQLVPQLIAKVLKSYPNSRAYFESLPTREIVQLLVSEQADLAISSAPLDHPVLDVQAVGRWMLRCAVPRTHPLATRADLDLREALLQPLVVYSPEAPQSRVIDGWLERFGIAPRVAVEVRSGYAACAMAAAGAGVAFVDSFSASAHPGQDVVFFDIPDTPTFEIYSAANVNRPLSKFGQSFIDLARCELAAWPPQ